MVEQASSADREVIYQIRHAVYAVELEQQPPRNTGRLSDAIDDWNVYLVVKAGVEIVGFISVTPPLQPFYSLEKYFDRNALPFPVNDKLHEIRLITVVESHRGNDVASLLLYAAFRWIESRGGSHVVALGSPEVLGLYSRCGLQPVGLRAQNGKVTYDLLHASLETLRGSFEGMASLVASLQQGVEWRLGVPSERPSAGPHGGGFYEDFGSRFEHLETAAQFINADVLDAWFPPAPGVVKGLEKDLAWLLRTAPPADCRGLLEVLAEKRGLRPEQLLPGAGSSDLIFRAFREWLTPSSRALILDPTYGEYAHVLEQIIGCQVDRLVLNAASDFDVNLDRLATVLRAPYDLVVLVNPNSPTGRHIPRRALERVLASVPSSTRVWVDEAYVDFVGIDSSLERFAANSDHVIVCKSMSKVYALSGARAAYLCGSPYQLERLRKVTPPWIISSVGQAAGLLALQDPDYYRDRYRETAQLRLSLSDGLTRLGWNITPGAANFLLGTLPSRGPNARTLLQRCRERRLFLRDAQTMGQSLGDRSVRIAVKDGATNGRMLSIIRDSMKD